MKYQDNFRKEYFEKIKEDGYEINGQMFVQMEKDLYIEWLETKLQNTPSNSGYMSALNEILHNRLDCLEMVNVDKLIGLINEDIQRLNQRS